MGPKPLFYNQMINGNCTLPMGFRVMRLVEGTQSYEILNGGVFQEGIILNLHYSFLWFCKLP